ncbi:ATP synthase F0 subcomplex B subunit [Leeuwenhoekiella aestuarii]|uniref:ATP synthase subunit b n=1 Tax=Leeuwenhoekiella aestuarii TaxID=2249426 RepID=A0A4Q0NUE1_9FLAO|nr:F0F1 ATP synthase subunit B [Leeuwenhoekiella aestuarii]RXG11645.1 ATP synthase F0 subcomplex B subunit [Leeuwenhoekiella aestuarii]RXG15144.1 ATP synthase F0 subcomplex B subunit [Leeuwenhoekiella aestuarii]
MKINWFTVIAQVINFLILVWLLKKFLYKPILNAVNTREKKITDELKDADAQKASAQQEKDDFKKKNTDFDTHKKNLMAAAVADAATQKEQLITAAKTQANELRTTMEKAAQEDQKNENAARAHDNQDQVFAMTRKALTAIASVSLEEHAANSFIQRLKSATEEEKKQMQDAFQSKEHVLLVRSAFALAEEQQASIKNVVKGVLNVEKTMEFKTDPQLVSGIELSTSGYKLGWNFSEYINALEEHTAEISKEKLKLQLEKKAVISN